MREKVISLTKKDFIVQSFTAGGHGGQNQNKTATGVRIIHPASGARAECRETRSWLENRGRAFRKLAESPKFRVWLAEVTHTLFRGKTIEEEVRDSMTKESLKWEIKNEKGRWAVVAEEDVV